jgi:hypothetical protein
MKQFDKRSLDIIVDEDLRYLHILSHHIDEIRRSYLTRTNKMLNWGKTMFKNS